MSIIRVVHNQENPFVQLNKKALWDTNISLKAVGLWARCMSRPDNWRFNIKELAASGKEKRSAIDSAINELIDNGYAVRIDYWDLDEYGKFKKGSGGIEYIFFEFPATQEDKDKILEELKKCFRYCGFRDRVSRDGVNQHLLIKNDTNTEKKEERISPIVPSGDLPSLKRKRKAETKAEVAPEVAVTPTQKEDLVKRLGEEKAQACFQKLSIWKIGKGITGGNDYKSIHNWVIKAVNEDENKPKPEDKEKANKKLAENIEAKLPRLPDQCRIEVLHKGIEITTGRNCEVINYNDPYFKDKLTHALRKFSLDIKSFEDK